MKLKMSNYTYPTKEEWSQFSNEVELENNFGFPWVPELKLLLNREKTIAEVNQIQNLHEWDCLLNKKSWNLRQSFINSMVNFHRGIALSPEDYKIEHKIINLLQYEFYAEMTFYYLISTRDLILQIINLAWELSLAESNKTKLHKRDLLVTLDNVKTKLQRRGFSDVHKIVVDMEIGMKESNDIRNSMTHSFSILDADRRSSISDDGSTYGAGTGHQISFEEQVRIMRKSLKAISIFMYSIRLELVKKGFVLELKVD
jgi:hypothetical protein